jgi:hypothetical protein
MAEPALQVVREGWAQGRHHVPGGSVLPVAVFEDPASPRRRLLAQPLPRRALSSLRDPYRSRDLLANRRDRVLVYELP